MELDLFDRGVDYRDFYRPRGGRSRLTLRRLLLLVEGMDVFDSRFWAEVNGIDFVPADVRIQADTFGLFAEKPHPMKTWREDMRREREKAAKKLAIERAMKRRARLLSG
ncbi:hypothetical protein [Corynebacterium sanguinis]|uniref:hypothetical protein n=1 Tax=Corynebacterium sanguinis TaxID=2594913 RepID=UPI0021A607C9|nr:hypothetical protein [Corynebacterium sanguinis]MCT1411649.1 hypothetical protein [Corynebacterium sanguinis]